MKISCRKEAQESQKKSEPFVPFGVAKKKFKLPFAYIDNLVAAVITTIQREKANNRTFNVVGYEKITKKQYMDPVMKKLYPKSFIVYFP